MPNTLPERYQRWLMYNSVHRPTVPDFDLLSPEAVRRWLDAIPRGLLTAEAAHCFPSKPPGFLQAYRLLCRIAYRRLKDMPFQDTYRQLPFWAKWREHLPVEACVIPGKQFRKRPRRTNPLDLLKGLEKK